LISDDIAQDSGQTRTGAEDNRSGAKGQQNCSQFQLHHVTCGRSPPSAAGHLDHKRDKNAL
jgi:hypothetical protein